MIENKTQINTVLGINTMAILGPYVNINVGRINLSEKEMFGSNYLDSVKYRTRYEAAKIKTMFELQDDSSGVIVFDRNKFIQTQRYIISRNNEFNRIMTPIQRSLRAILSEEPHTRIENDYILKEKNSYVATMNAPGFKKGTVFLLSFNGKSYLELCGDWYIFSGACDLLNHWSNRKLGFLIK